MIDDKVKSGGRFNFHGWENGDTPLSRFDHCDWVNCAHGVCLMLYLLDSKSRAYSSLADDGILHELIHLATGIDICTHHTLVELRRQLESLQIKFLEMMA